MHERHRPQRLSPRIAMTQTAKAKSSATLRNAIPKRVTKYIRKIFYAYASTNLANPHFILSITGDASKAFVHTCRQAGAAGARSRRGTKSSAALAPPSLLPSESLPRGRSSGTYLASVPSS
jgi:hypothetical protein